MDRHPYRPAHIHFHVQAPGHKTLVTQVFSRDSQYLDDDAVFAVKDSLIVDFVKPTAPLPKGGEFDEEIKYVRIPFSPTLRSRADCERLASTGTS